ncbi:GTPase Rab2, small G protein superfamily [Phaffia rhodozyma]|uniref:GTPase Rab2, small G protein superfamily n=1 Tax=Phaffia rhodozyma TaxID=264483 RepID=A0A0F7SS29_PHARH|nr:GTPase Rab2, small G protein superfamily [Phaffia rhodozyma]
MSSPSWDYIMKFVIAGEAATGKTSILYRLTDSRFLTTPDPTIGVEFGSKLLRVAPLPPKPSSPSVPSGDSGTGDVASQALVAQPERDETAEQLAAAVTVPTVEGETAEEEEEGAKWVKLQCWDVAGSPSFRSITKSYYRGAAGALLVYDVTRSQTFRELPLWLKDLRAHADPSVSIILLGNKSDLDSSAETSTTTPGEDAKPRSGKREVSREEAQAFAEREGLMFLECSAKSGEGVNEAFDKTGEYFNPSKSLIQSTREILQKINQGLFKGDTPSSKSKSSGIKLSANSSADSKSRPGESARCC